MARGPISTLLAGASLFGVFSLTYAQSPCAQCHGEQTKLAASAHSGVECVACHPGHEKHPHSAAAPPACASCHSSVAGDWARSVHGRASRAGNAGAPACDTCHGKAHEAARARAQEFRKAVPDTCGMCHTEIAGQFRSSVHGKAVARGITQAPVCTDCHGEHSIEKPTSQASLVHPSHIRETCANCHGNVRLSRKFGLPADRIVSFDASYHGLATKAGSQTVASCASCHGFHNILASTDPNSTIHPKTCRPPAGIVMQARGHVLRWGRCTSGPAVASLLRCAGCANSTW